MYSALEMFVHAGPVSLVAMSDLAWEKHMLRSTSSPRRRNLPRFLSIHLGPVELCLRLSSPVSTPGTS
jgi:hypothetical protein